MKGWCGRDGRWREKEGAGYLPGQVLAKILFAVRGGLNHEVLFWLCFRLWYQS
jgi:hypothetical protein